MKKRYAKPALAQQSMELQSPVIRTCADAASAWPPLPMENGIVVFLYEMIDCNMTEEEYMNDGTNDYSCLQSVTESNMTFNS